MQFVLCACSDLKTWAPAVKQDIKDFKLRLYFLIWGLRVSVAELLSQLSGVRRSAGGQLSSGPSASQLQQLQMQLQLERQQAQAARQQLETARNATRGGGRANAILNTNSASANPNPSANHTNNPSPNPGPAESNTQHTAHSSQFLLSR